MKNFRISKTLLGCLLGIFMIISSCEKTETGMDNQAPGLQSELSAKGKNPKFDVCHNNHIINVSINAVPAHLAHGDAIDMDADGYFDIDNTCSETDCDDDDPSINPGTLEYCGDGNVAELLIGSWITVDIALTASVEGLSVSDYLIDVVGLSPADAAVRNAVFEAAQEAELNVTLVLYSDNTYESFFAGGSDGGTWSLSADETTLTLIEGGVPIVATINSISETTLVATLVGVIPFDLDGDPGTPEDDVATEATLTLTRS